MVAKLPLGECLAQRDCHGASVRKPGVRKQQDGKYLMQKMSRKRQAHITEKQKLPQ